MPIKFECQECGREYTVRDEYAGRNLKCKNVDCAAKIVVPQIENNEYKNCPECGSSVKLKFSTCLKCGFNFKTCKRNIIATKKKQIKKLTPRLLNKFKICPDCSYEINSELSICEICGFNFITGEESSFYQDTTTEDDEYTQTNTQNLYSREIENEISRVHYCQNCGSRILSNMTKCTNCGLVQNFQKKNVQIVEKKYQYWMLYVINVE